MALQMRIATPSATLATWSSSRSIISSPSSAASTLSRRGSTLQLISCSSKSPPGPSPRPGPQDNIDPSTTKQELGRAADANQRYQADSSSNVGSPPTPPTTPEQRPQPSLASLFAFNGAAPETINGRMAMVGFVWALAAEKTTGVGVVDQLFDPSISGFPWFGAVVGLFTLASIIPLIAKDEAAETRRWGPFNAKAERWNGRLAMLGFAALVVVEIVRQAPLLYV